MTILCKEGNSANIPLREYYCESEEEVKQLPVDTPVGSTALVLTKEGLTVHMKHSDGTWKKI